MQQERESCSFVLLHVTRPKILLTTLLLWDGCITSAVISGAANAQTQHNACIQAQYTQSRLSLPGSGGEAVAACKAWGAVDVHTAGHSTQHFTSITKTADLPAGVLLAVCRGHPHTHNATHTKVDMRPAV